AWLAGASAVGRRGAVGAERARSATMGGGGTAVVEAVASATSGAAARRAPGRGAIRVRTASARRPSSATTAARPIRIKPPVNALTPATMSVVPRVNSLIGMPNPIAAMPTAASTIPNKDKITDMLTPRLYALPRPAILGGGHDAMVTKEF